MNDKESKKFAAKVYYFMQLKGTNQSKMAREIGVTRPYIYQVIHGFKTGKAIRAKIAKNLGFRSWKALQEYEEVLK